LAAQEGNTHHEIAFIFLHQPSAPGTAAPSPASPTPLKTRRPPAWHGSGQLQAPLEVRAGKQALLPVSGREVGTQSHSAHLGEVKESKLAKPALNQLAWFGSAAGETPTTGKMEHGQVTLGVKQVRRRGSGWPGCCGAPSRASWLWRQHPEVRAGGQWVAKPVRKSCTSSGVQLREGASPGRLLLCQLQ